MLETMLKLTAKLFNISRADLLLVAATVVAALRMMLINSQAIGFNVKGWSWFAPAEVVSGIAFAVLEGVALAYVSKRWRRFQPVGWTGWGYWVILLAGQLVLLAAIVWVTGVAFVATRQNLTIDDVLQPGAALVWSMLVAAINPLIVILIGIVEDDKQAGTRPPWPPLETQLTLFIQELGDVNITPDEAVRKFAELTGQSIATRIFAHALARRTETPTEQTHLRRTQANLSQLSTRVDAGATDEGAQGALHNAPDTKAITTRGKQAGKGEPVQGDVLPVAVRRVRVREMHAAGVSQAEMGRVLGVHSSTVKRDLEAMGREDKMVQGNGKVKV